MSVRYQRAADLVELTGLLQTTVTGLAIDEIAARFEVSRRTAERMLGALRERFPELRPDLRAGRKYWKLSSNGHARPIQLPRTLEALSERIAELESEVLSSRSKIAELKSISDGVLSTAPVGLVVIDAAGRVVCTNATLSKMLALPTESFVGLDLATVALTELNGVVAEPARLARRLSGHRSRQLDDDFRLQVLAGEGRLERELRHLSRPIESGRYAGGRVDRWVDVTRPSDQLRVQVQPELPETSARFLREHVALVQEATTDFLESRNLPPEVALRLDVLSRAQLHSIETTVEAMERGVIKREQMVAAEVLDVAAALIRPYAADRNVDVRIEVAPDLPEAFGDRALTVSALVLIARATLEGVPDGSTLAIRAVELSEPRRLRLSLLDSGPSLPEDFPDFLGEFFPTQNGGGVGIGIQPARDAAGDLVPGIEQFCELPISEPAS